MYHHVDIGHYLHDDYNLWRYGTRGRMNEHDYSNGKYHGVKAIEDLSLQDIEYPLDFYGT